MVDRSFVEENLRSRERLRELADRLTDADLAAELEEGWTVSAMLAHLSFWDRRMLVLIERWKREGVGSSEIDSDVVNGGNLPLWRAVEPRAALRLALESAEAVDREFEALPAENITKIIEIGVWFRFARAVHRNGHLDFVEAGLATM